MSLSFLGSSQTIAGYYPINNELNILPLLQLLSSIGYQSLVGALFVQASKQAATMGITIRSAGGGTMDNFPITSLEVLSVLSNTQVLFAHLIGLIFSLWLLQRIYLNRK